MHVWMIAIDPENEIDSVPFASEEDAMRHCEDYFREYFKDDGITQVEFDWRPEEKPWEDIRHLYVNGSRQPCLLWHAQVHTYLTAKRKEVNNA